ncbi:MAG: U32 family peptidase [Lachnospiraceae bacterium]|nr:U32 family peptidase [Ruminococcus sp.]MCM1274008.1 U32 family peptidase [Lachnospiraceae bacterium]
MESKDLKAELLAPAGDGECLLSALDYGADAVYLAGKEFGMRAGAKNFGTEELFKAVQTAHERGVKVYIACNTVPANDEVERFPEFIRAADESGVDAAIAADIGVISMIKEHAPRLAVHASTQTGVTNYKTALELYKMGVCRVVLAREVDLGNIRTIRKNIPEDMEIETFVHGAMCVSFSGRCLISEYLTGRNANRGECAQPCRWGYYLMEEKRPNEFYKIFEDEKGTFILNARDMCMIEHLDDLLDAGVTSLKIEGRAKSAYYTALTTNAYRVALDCALLGEKPPAWVLDEVNKISHRPYCTGFFYGHPNEGSGSQNPDEITNGGQYFTDSGYIRDYDFVATVDKCENGTMYLTTRNYFTLSDELEILAPNREPIKFAPAKMFNADMEEIDVARHAMSKLTVPSDIVVPAHSLLRKKL